MNWVIPANDQSIFGIAPMVNAVRLIGLGHRTAQSIV